MSIITNILMPFLIMTLIQLKHANSNECLKKSSQYFNYMSHNDNLTWSFLKNFKKFTDLILDCNQTYNITKHVILWPKDSLVIDESVQLNKVFDESKIKSIAYLNIINFKGIDINSQSFLLDSSRFKLKLKINIYFSKLDIYSNSSLIEASKCDLATYNVSNNFFKHVYSISIQNVKYPKEWCPHFFHNFVLGHLFFFEIANSFLIKNRLNFYQLNSSKVYIKYLFELQFDFTYEELNKNNLSPDLFRNVPYLGIGGVLNGIETRLFEDFQNLKKIEIVISNLKEIFHSGNKWMNYLNLKVSLNTSTNLEQSMQLKFRFLSQHVSFDSIYQYPNEDLCLFKNFPHDRLVYPIMIPGKRLKCTCTLLWLESKLHLFKSKVKFLNDYDLIYDADYSVSESIFVFCNVSFNTSKCNLNEKFMLCKIVQSESTSREHLFHFDNDVDVYYMIEFAKFILLVILQPIFCFLGIIHNGLTILVIRNKSKKKELSESMYKHIIINSVFNTIYCTITILKLVNTCVFHDWSVFCSTVYQEIWAQNLKIFLIHFLGTSVKLCSNFSYFIFSLSRLLLITKHKDRILNRETNKIYIIIYIIALIFVSCVLSAFKIFQYEINYNMDFSKEYPMEIRDEKYCNSESHKFECKLFDAFKIANRSLNDVLFLILNFFIDIILLIKFKRHMNRKLGQINDSAQHKVIEKSKKNVNRMIFFNSLIYIVSHLPEFVITLILIIYARKISAFCKEKISCDLLNEEAEFFSLISMVCQFYVFKIFDNNFRSSFDDIKKSLYSLISRKKTKANSSVQHQNLELHNLKNLIGNGLKD
jgi:hypothetical protein